MGGTNIGDPLLWNLERKLKIGTFGVERTIWTDVKQGYGVGVMKGVMKADVEVIKADVAARNIRVVQKMEMFICDQE